MKKETELKWKRSRDLRNQTENMAFAFSFNHLINALRQSNHHFQFAPHVQCTHTISMAISNKKYICKKEI